jgi:hypothetical protein
MSAHQLVSALVDALPAPARVEPTAFLHDDRIPPAFTPVEPAAFALACTQALWGPYGRATEAVMASFTGSVPA